MKRLKINDRAHLYMWSMTSNETFAAGNRTADRLPGTLRGGMPDNVTRWDCGSLPEPYRSEYRAADLEYVVWSYHTPIAWRTVDSVWRIPPVTYSLATSRHLHTIRQAVQLIIAETWQTADLSGEPVSLRKGRGAKGVFGPRGW